MKKLVMTTAIATLAASAAWAVDVTFTGTVPGNCTVSVDTAGVMALSNDQRQLDSSLGGGTSAVVNAVSNAAGMNITFTPPLANTIAFTAAQGAIFDDGDVTEMALRISPQTPAEVAGEWVTEAEVLHHALDAGGQNEYELDHRITLGGSFPAGDYTSTVVVTCAAAAAP